MGAMGSAIASLVTQTFIIAVEMYIAITKFHFKIEKTFVFKLSIFTLGVILFNIFCHYLPFHWGIDFMITLFATLILVFVTRLINIKHVLMLFKIS